MTKAQTYLALPKGTLFCDFPLLSLKEGQKPRGFSLPEG
jgi:hypothetical protein